MSYMQQIIFYYCFETKIMNKGEFIHNSAFAIGD